jgi:hypothetical protein
MNDDFLNPYRKDYMPAITKARWVRYFQLGLYRAVVGSDCESIGSIQYAHVMYVFKKLEQHPCLAVTSEYSDEFGEDGSRFLCVFFAGSHLNTGFSRDWADLDSFIHKALEMAVRELNISEAPEELPL